MCWTLGIAHESHVGLVSARLHFSFHCVKVSRSRSLQCMLKTFGQHVVYLARVITVNLLHILKVCAGFGLFLSLSLSVCVPCSGFMYRSVWTWWLSCLLISKSTLTSTSAWCSIWKEITQTGSWVQLVNKDYCISTLIPKRLLHVCWFFCRLSPSEVIPLIFPVCKDFFQVGYTLSLHAVVQECPASSAFTLCSVLLCIISCIGSLWAALHWSISVISSKLWRCRTTYCLVYKWLILVGDTGALSLSLCVWKKTGLK